MNIGVVRVTGHPTQMNPDWMEKCLAPSGSRTAVADTLSVTSQAADRRHSAVEAGIWSARSKQQYSKPAVTRGNIVLQRRCFCEVSFMSPNYEYVFRRALSLSVKGFGCRPHD